MTEQLLIRAKIDALIGLIKTGLTTLAGYVALIIKSYFETKSKNEEIEKIVKTAVRAGEQMFKDFHGEEKLNLVLEGASAMLTEKGINVSEFELKWMIESAIGEFNDVFNSESTDKDEGTAA